MSVLIGRGERVQTQDHGCLNLSIVAQLNGYESGSTGTKSNVAFEDAFRHTHSVLGAETRSPIQDVINIFVLLNTSALSQPPSLSLCVLNYQLVLLNTSALSQPPSLSLCVLNYQLVLLNTPALSQPPSLSLCVLNYQLCAGALTK